LYFNSISPSWLQLDLDNIVVVILYAFFEFLGCPPPDPFELPLTEALPLADQPQLLQPNARREDLFGMPKQPITVPVQGNYLYFTQS